MPYVAIFSSIAVFAFALLVVKMMVGMAMMQMTAIATIPHDFFCEFHRFDSSCGKFVINAMIHYNTRTHQKKRPN
ncbi:hypothetical protein PCORN_08342 [Listeria cornellensis FSL F6-0969]|uniref:Uncharacterized protein n=1 Tax=Listeria cornellensis FSL F6-0969 TaxID=1265820 RepID=W7C017_9LIST|nr:hypothetical protein PCORN_08342 [Listeria cornellensis FSL F6-0969]